MIWLALAAVVLSGLKMWSTYSQASGQTKALKREANIKAGERAKSTKTLAAKQKVSFLSSGISLTGEGTPQALIGETYNIGLEDIRQSGQNYASKIKNVWGAARTSMLSELQELVSVGGVFGGSGGGGLGSPSSSSESANRNQNQINTLNSNKLYNQNSYRARA